MQSTRSGPQVSFLKSHVTGFSLGAFGQLESHSTIAGLTIRNMNDREETAHILVSRALVLDILDLDRPEMLLNQRFRFWKILEGYVFQVLENSGKFWKEMFSRFWKILENSGRRCFPGSGKLWKIPEGYVFQSLDISGRACKSPRHPTVPACQPAGLLACRPSGLLPLLFLLLLPLLLPLLLFDPTTPFPFLLLIFFVGNELTGVFTLYVSDQERRTRFSRIFRNFPDSGKFRFTLTNKT